MTKRNTGRSGRQMKPLNQRMTAADLQLRAARIIARRTVAEKLEGQLGHMRLVLGHFFTRGFFGRMKWLATGR